MDQQCPNCKAKILDTQAICPHCGIVASQYPPAGEASDSDSCVKYCGCMGLVVGLLIVIGSYVLGELSVMGDDRDLTATFQILLWCGVGVMAVSFAVLIARK